MTIQFSMQSSVQPAVLAKAILIYESQHRFYSSINVEFATLHDVRNTGTKDKPNVQIMPGTPVSQESIISMMGSLGKKFVLNAELLPENVLSFSPIHLVWWSSATNRRVFFDNKEIGKRSAVVPHPPLLNIVVGRSWYVFAMKENKRPTKETKLYHAPYFNVYDDGKICVGTAAIPDHLTSTMIPQWEAAFFDSAFTHTNGQIRKASHPRGEYALWKELLDGAYKEFPLQYLVETDATLDGAIKGVRNHIGANRG